MVLAINMRNGGTKNNAFLLLLTLLLAFLQHIFCKETLTGLRSVNGSVISLRISAAKSSKQVTFPWHSAANSHQGRRSKGAKASSEEEQISHFLRIRSIPISSQLCIRHRSPFSDSSFSFFALTKSPSTSRSSDRFFVFNPIFRIESSYYPAMSTAHPSPVARQSSAKKQKTDHEQDADGIPIPEVT